MVELEDTLQSGETSTGDGPTAVPASAEDATVPADSVPPGGGDFAELADVPRENYEIGAEIARGGMGRIVAARDRRAGRPIVIKEVRGDLLSLLGEGERQALVRRFKREAMLTARLQHPSVVPVYEIGRFGDTPFIAMKRVEGTPLLDLFEATESLADRLALLPRVIAVAEAIAYAHAEGVVHRDLKPANILVGAFGETVVIDWGLAKLAGEPDESTSEPGGESSAAPVPGDVETVAGAIFGTPAYMAPEQAAGESVGPAADVYAIGAILYHLLAGAAPYSASGDPRALVERVRDEPPPPIGERAPGAPADLVSLVEKAMARDRSERYASAGELASDLRSFERGQLVEVHDYSTWELVSRWIARRRSLVLTALTLTIAGAAATSWFVVQTVAARDEARREEARAEAQLRAAMETTYERGKRELLVDRRRAIESLATAYRHLDEPLLARELGEAMLGLEGFVGAIERPDEAVEEVVLSADGERVAVTGNRKIEVIDLASRAVAYELDGKAPRFAGGGRYLVHLDSEGAVIRDAASGERLGLIELPMVTRSSFAVSDHADLAFVVGDDVSERGMIYSLSERRRLFAFSIDTVYVGAIRISRNGQRILIGQPITTVYSREGEVLYKAKKLNFNAVTGLSPDGEQFAIVEGGGLAIRESSSGELVTRIRSVGQKVDDVSFSADGRRVLLSTRGHSCVWRLADQTRLGCHETLNPGLQISFTPDFERIVTSREDGAVEVWSGTTGRVRTVLAAHSDGAPGVAISGDGSQIVTGGIDGAVRLWRGDADTLTARVAHPRGHYALSNHSNLVVFSGSERLEVWDPDRPDNALAVIESSESIGKYAAVSAGAEVAVWAGYGWEPLTGKRLGAIDNWSNLHAFAIDAAGEIFVGCGSDGFVYTHDPRSGALLWKFDLADAFDLRSSSRRALVLCSPLFVPDEPKVLIRIGGTDLVFDARTGSLLRRLEHSKNGMSLNYTAAFFGDHGYAAADGMQIYLWDLASGARLDTFSGGARGLVAHPDGRRLLLPLTEANFIYDTASQERRRLASFAMPRGGAAFSPDSTMVAIGGLAEAVEIYDVVSGRQIARRGPGGSTQRIGFSRGGRLVVTSRDRTLIWELPVEHRTPDHVDRVVADRLGKRR